MPCGCDEGCDNYKCERHRLVEMEAQMIQSGDLRLTDASPTLQEIEIAVGVAPTTSPASGVGPDPMIGIGGGPTRATILPSDPKRRKQYPMATGLLDYFPDALAAVAHVSWQGNEQHNPGEPLHWARGKSTDEADTLLRHFSQRGTLDSDGQRHSAKVAWRALALLQKEIEAERGLLVDRAV